MKPTSAPAVWLADLDLLHDRLEALEARSRLLSADERAWSSGPPEVRRRRRTARIALRLLLHRAGAPAARGLEFMTEAGGKPRLGDADASGPRLSFNVSHSAGHALIAIAGGPGPVGVDIEAQRTVQLDARRQALIIAAGMALAGDGWHSAPPEARPHVLGAWTRLEAFAKARGSGMGHLLTELGILASRDRRLTDAEAAASAARLRDAEGLSVASLALPAGLFGAVAAAASSPPRCVQVLTADDCLAAGRLAPCD